MSKRKYQKGQNPWILIFGIIAMIAMLFTIFSQKSQDTLDVYKDADKVAIATPTVEDTGLEIDTSIYTDNEHHFSMEIPSDWEEVTKSGFTTFIHSSSASSIQIQILEYDPAINNDSSNNLSTKVVEKGMTFTSFTKQDNSSYQLMYQDYKNSTYDYIEEVYWDRDTIIKLVCTFNDANYEKIIPYFELILNSFAWQKTSAIPEGYALYYNENACFEVLVPDTWTLGAAENAVVATDPETGASETMTILTSTNYLDTVTATDMAGLLNTGQNNFMMSSYKNSKESATAKCTYIVNNVQYQEEVYAFATGKQIYFVMFDYEVGMIDETLPAACAKSFRAFPAVSEEEPTSEAEKDSGDESEAIEGTPSPTPIPKATS